jgi:hypothetical protein
LAARTLSASRQSARTTDGFMAALRMVCAALRRGRAADGDTVLRWALRALVSPHRATVKLRSRVNRGQRFPPTLFQLRPAPPPPPAAMVGSVLDAAQQLAGPLRSFLGAAAWSFQLSRPGRQDTIQRPLR